MILFLRFSFSRLPRGVNAFFAVFSQFAIPRAFLSEGLVWLPVGLTIRGARADGGIFEHGRLTILEQQSLTLFFGGAVDDAALAGCPQPAANFKVRWPQRRGEDTAPLPWPAVHGRNARF